jgi:hypothetical protein
MLFDFAIAIDSAGEFIERYYWEHRQIEKADSAKMQKWKAIGS